MMLANFIENTNMLSIPQGPNKNYSWLLQLDMDPSIERTF